MLKTLFITFLKPALYAAVPIVCGLLIDLINHSISTFQPNGDVSVTIWQVALVPLGAGLVKLLVRWKNWDSSKVGQ